MNTDLVNRGLIVLNESVAEKTREFHDGTTIIVTGVARGGTSMVAQVLERLGLFIGNIINPAVNEDSEIRAALQSSDLGRLDALIANRNHRFEKWGFKVPNLHKLLAPKEEQRFRNPRFIIVYRDPLAIARRNVLSIGQDPATAIREAGQNVMNLTLYALKLTRPTLLVSYEKTLQNVEGIIEAMSNFCELTPSAKQKATASMTINSNRSAYLTKIEFGTQSIYRGTVDKIRGNTLQGWCCYRNSSDTVEMELLVGEERVGVFAAGDTRSDLLARGIHSGRHAFNIDLTPFQIDASSIIWVRPAGSVHALPNSGQTVEALRARNK